MSIKKSDNLTEIKRLVTELNQKPYSSVLVFWEMLNEHNGKPSQSDGSYRYDDYRR